MGVYIKGLEMPKSCGNCFFDTRCDNWRLRNWGAPPPDDCPLVPVPTHGRLISAELLKAEFTGNFTDAYPTALVHAMIDDAPTIIPAEEVSGNSGELED